MQPPFPLVLTRRQSQELDRRAVEQYGIPSAVLMENAGRGVADTLERLGIASGVLICCGRGNNGGDGLVVARHLDLRGYSVRVALWADTARLSPDAALNLGILQRAGFSLAHFPAGHEPDRLEGLFEGVDWVVDALLGTGTRGNPVEPLDQVIDQLNRRAAGNGVGSATRPAILAVDVPSGLDCDSGRPGAPTIRAAHTVTMVSLKPGFLVPGAESYTGQVHVVDIGAPRQLIAEVVQGQ